MILGKTPEGFGFPLQPGESCAAGKAVPLTYGKQFKFVPKLALYPNETAISGATEVPFDEMIGYEFS
jgi:hypothetical protein